MLMAKWHKSIKNDIYKQYLQNKVKKCKCK